MQVKIKKHPQLDLHSSKKDPAIIKDSRDMNTAGISPNAVHHN